MAKNDYLTISASLSCFTKETERERERERERIKNQFEFV
jgi:hypothetical protein